MRSTDQSDLILSGLVFHRTFVVMKKAPVDDCFKSTKVNQVDLVTLALVGDEIIELVLSLKSTKVKRYMSAKVKIHKATKIKKH